MPAALAVIRLLDSEDIVHFSSIIIPVPFRPNPTFLFALSDADRIAALRACLLVFTVTRGRLVPHDLQLQAGLAALNGKECVVIARTGWGKTLCIAIPILLRPDRVAITISPLKRLQMMQVSDFLTKFGISTVAINEDTPNCPVLWSVRAISEGKVSHLIVQPEQFSLYHGHLPRMARLLHDHKFVSRVAAVAVDECHNIYMVGSAVNGRAPFRPSYGALPQLRVRLGTTTAWSFLSATVPAHIFDHVKESMGIGPSPTIIRVSINRPNLIYATHILVGGRGNLRNLDLIIPPIFHPPMRIPKLVIFHGNKAETAAARQHVDSLLPEAFQNTGIVRHYHADLSPEYLEDAYSSFADPDGMCLILHATAGAGEGLDVAGINGVIIYGIVADIPTKSQWEGRAGRSTEAEAFCVQMIEPWVPEIDTSEMVMDPNDPDRPLSDVALAKKHPTKQEQTGRASIHHATSPQCERVLKAAYYQDHSPDALHYTGRWCCDSQVHTGNSFALDKLFLGPVYRDQPAPVPQKRNRNTYRPTKDRPELEALLISWRADMHTRFTLRAIRPPSFILDGPAIKKLVMAPASSITSAVSVTLLLKQSPEWAYLWAGSLYELVSKFKPGVGEEDGGDSDEEAPPPKRRKS
ncbi:P-loop containing nucleoside triphosphate hydrolase protein [Mycena pura]|uniref:DNA 3'-5' helicase n=1 Tax=Mycena pura TaxID=153505 RepID=A0AAD6VJG7_9AGAR|nr:P-loop containing nucleoside triphosphate hydrolase protein [Mycena pura]